MKKLILLLIAASVLFSGCMNSPSETTTTLPAIEQTTQPAPPSTSPPTTQAEVTTTLASTTTTQNGPECSADSDCIPSSCCHAATCVKGYQRVCNMACTQSCEGPLDCGKGSCGCVNGKCAVISATTTLAPSTTLASAPKTVLIQSFSFKPSPITVAVGTTVTWENMDSAPHTVTSDSGGELASGSLSKGQTYSHTFTAPGTYAYHCGVHTSMKGTVIVQ